MSHELEISDETEHQKVTKKINKTKLAGFQEGRLLLCFLRENAAKGVLHPNPQELSCQVPADSNNKACEGQIKL